MSDRLVGLTDLKHAAALFGESDSPEELGIDGDAFDAFLQEQLTHQKAWSDGTPAPSLDPLSFATGISIGVRAVRHALESDDTDEGR